MPILQDSSLVIVGGNGPVGRYFMGRVAAAGLTASVISRRTFDAPEGFTKIRADLNQATDWEIPVNATIVSFLPLWILADLLPRFAQAKTIIATGSTSRFSKAASGDAKERDVAAKLEAAETAIQIWAQQHQITWTLLRPTLIYDCLTDINIARMARFIRRWRFLPVAAPARGLRQPIHTDDVAKAAFHCLGNSGTANKAFNISGGEILSYRTMAERVFLALGLRPRFLMLPQTFLQKLFCAASRLGFVTESNFGASMFQRMNEDLIFDTEEGLKVLAYDPRPFKPVFPGP